MNTQSGRVLVLGWFSLALLFIIMGSVLFWFILAAVSIPHARLLAKAYAGSADCSPSMILQTGALQSQLPASTDAPGTTLCEVLPMTVVNKDFSHVKNYTSYSVTLTNEAGKYYSALLDRASWGVGDDLRIKMKVKVQLVAGKVALIANGKEIARTMDHPEINLRELYQRLTIFGLVSLPILSFLVSWIKRKMKRKRPASRAIVSTHL